jgi:hypothetical protein
MIGLILEIVANFKHLSFVEAHFMIEFLTHDNFLTLDDFQFEKSILYSLIFESLK